MVVGERTKQGDGHQKDLSKIINPIVATGTALCITAIVGVLIVRQRVHSNDKSVAADESIQPDIALDKEII